MTVGPSVNGEIQSSPAADGLELSYQRQHGKEPGPFLGSRTVQFILCGFSYNGPSARDPPAIKKEKYEKMDHIQQQMGWRRRDESIKKESHRTIEILKNPKR